MPTLVLLAGPNGAGKTTFINGFLRERAEAFQVVTPDDAARHLPPGPGRDLVAGPLFRHPPASRAAARTGGPSGARECERTARRACCKDRLRRRWVPQPRLRLAGG